MWCNVGDQLQVDNTQSHRETWRCRPESRQEHYRLGIIQEVRSSKNEKLRSALVKYKNYKAGERNHEYTAGEEVVVSQSVHRLALLVTVKYGQEKIEADR